MEEIDFFEGFYENLTQDLREMSGAFDINNERQGRDEKTKRELEAEIFRIVGEMGGSAPVDMLDTVSSMLVELPSAFESSDEGLDEE